MQQTGSKTLEKSSRSAIHKSILKEGKNADCADDVSESHRAQTEASACRVTDRHLHHLTELSNTFHNVPWIERGWHSTVSADELGDRLHPAYAAWPRFNVTIRHRRNDRAFCWVTCVLTLFHGFEESLCSFTFLAEFAIICNDSNLNR